jgi:hypothetical protein
MADAFARRIIDSDRPTSRGLPPGGRRIGPTCTPLSNECVSNKSRFGRITSGGVGQPPSDASAGNFDLQEGSEYLRIRLLRRIDLA